MKKKKSIRIYFLMAIGLLLIFTYSCKKEDPIIKKDPIITWSNPAVITAGTLLSSTQLNATANVAGTFVYTPGIGTSLTAGANQDLRVDFTPNDLTNYNTASKTVKINVTVVTIIDADGNIYHTVTIGAQTWMVENLRTTKYNDGTSIPLVTDATEWAGLTTAAYCWYNNYPIINKPTFGALYNWYAVNTGKLAPSGWHVPTFDDWATLTTYLGGDQVAGGKLKETGTSLWANPNIGATNESGFTALPGGNRTYSGLFANVNELGVWWGATELNPLYDAWMLIIYNNYNLVIRDTEFKQNGFSVRCVKD